VIGLLSDLIATANELYHPHRARFHAAALASVRRQQQASAEQALRALSAGTSRGRERAGAQAFKRGQSRSRSPNGGGQDNPADDYLDVLRAVDASAKEARSLVQQRNANATPESPAGARSASPTSPLAAAKGKLAALVAAGLPDSDSDDDDDLTASTGRSQLSAEDRSRLAAANLEKKAARAQQVWRRSALDEA
jgi:hypothetical protein